MNQSSERYTLKAQEAMAAAERLAEERSHQLVEPEHLLWALLEQDEGVALELLRQLGVDARVLKQQLRTALEELAQVSGVAQRYASPRLSSVLQQAAQHAKQMTDEYVSVEHLLLALAADRDGAAGRLLRQTGATSER